MTQVSDFASVEGYFSEAELERLSFSDEYAEYIMEHSAGDRLICNGDMLLVAMEDLYLWEDFLETKIGE